jgi:Carbon starvation protein CstA
MTGDAVVAPPQPTPDTDNTHLSYVHNDVDLPPVAIIDRSPIRTRHKIFFGLIAVVGAVAWTIIAFVRGETVNAVWFVVAAICTYVIGYRFYARLIEAKIVRPRDDHATPAEVFDDGTDYVPTDRRVLFGHHFAGSSSVRCSPALCRTTWCCGSPPDGAAARSVRWPATSSAPRAVLPLWSGPSSSW